MMKKKILALALCAALPFIMAGCGNGKVESTVSQVVSRMGDDISETVSRMESAVESFFEPESSRLDEELSSAGSHVERLDEESGLSSEKDGLSSGERDIAGEDRDISSNP